MGATLFPMTYRMIGQDAMIVMRVGKGRQPVRVTHDALADIQSPPRSDATRLAEYIEVFAAIATGKIDAGEIAFDGRVWITGDDVRTWLFHRNAGVIRQMTG